MPLPVPGDPADLLAAHLPAPLRAAIEARYWAPIGEAAAFEHFIDDPALHAAPERHPALFSDHGVVHVRDIAASAQAIAAPLHGLLLPARGADGVHAVEGLAVLLAYFHDIGMVEPTAEGRRVHPQFAAQTVLGAGFDDLAEALWQADAGRLRSRLVPLARHQPLAPPPAWIAREVLALALAHSKSAVPVALLDDPVRLRRLMQRACFTDLAHQRHTRLADGAGRALEAPSPLVARYADVDRDAFAWLDSADAGWRAFAAEVVDAVRVLRAADALRQRGTTLRTSAGYEICTDRRTGEAVVGLRTRDERQALLLRFENPISAAEANLRAVTLTPEGGLAVECWRGRFEAAGARERLLAVTADVVADIEADALASFTHPLAPPPAARRIVLSSPADDAGFAGALAAQIAQRHPALAARVDLAPQAPALPPAALPAWAAGARPLTIDAAARDALFERLAQHGLNVGAIDRERALQGTRRLTVGAGTVLIEPGDRAGFVVVPLGEGLTLQPQGGYAARALQPWQPLGVTGVVRDGERNARVQAAVAVDVLVIDAAHYLADWFRPYDLAALRARTAAA